ncbi:LacI family DNA-binding transcriptional regulator [Nocardioides taihuensis]|uniref:LacI family DNA-binding transcriptional regulator n=1 Tax=Nocardioides taihuensis TaxID=1835606 RepID=A0ABW0BPT3_9ACTN
MPVGDPRQRRATMQQVAALAGVSLKTVSRVVNGEAGVSPEMTGRVQDAVQRLGYRHHHGASNLRSGRPTGLVGALVQDISNDFCAELLRAVEAATRERGQVVAVASLDDEPQRERAAVEGLIRRRCDGLILMPSGTDQSYLQAEVSAGLPIVAVDRPPGNIALDSVTSDNLGGARDATAHLLRQGHRRIACLVDDLGIMTATARRDGYLAALREAGVTVDTQLVVGGLRTDADAAATLTRLLAVPNPPTAVFAGRNTITLGAVRALRATDLSHTVALVGFDDVVAADLLDPPVTTIRQDAATEGRLAVEILLARLDGDPSPLFTEVLPTELVVRGSGEIPAPRSP